MTAPDAPVEGGPVPTVEEVRAAFDGTVPGTVGLEEEVLLVDAETGAPVPVALDVVARAGDPRIKPELPAAQLELATTPHASVLDAVAELAALRRLLLQACPASVVPIAAAVHPLARGPAVLTDTGRSRAIAEDYRSVAEVQLVGALQVHVALGDADTALAVYNALRGLLPELAALAAAAPFHGGHDSGLASVRPLLCTLLPRQGVPPPIASWGAFLEDLRWGATTGRVRGPGLWWWELRPHLRFGTLEIRVPDAQPTLEAAAAVAGVAAALVGDLADQHRRGVALGAAPSWRIGENRWSALRDGTHGHLADLDTGEPVPTARRLHALVDAVERCAPGGLDGARRLIERSAADELRTVGPTGAVRWLAEAFAP